MRKRWMLLPLLILGGLAGGSMCGSAAAEDTILDPVTGIRYRREYRTVKRPIAETRMEEKVVTVSRPETVSSVEPVTRTYFTPVVRYDWQPRWHGVWNPFTPATLAYHYVPQTQWEARTDTYNQTKSSTRWVAEQRVVTEPRLVTRIEEQQEEVLVAVDRVPTSGTQVASLSPSTGLSPISQTYAAPAVAPVIRGGMAPTVLDPYSTRSNVARIPAAPLFR